MSSADFSGRSFFHVKDGLVPANQSGSSPQHVGLHTLHVHLDQVQPGARRRKSSSRTTLMGYVLRGARSEQVMASREMPPNVVGTGIVKVVVKKNRCLLLPDPQMVGMDVGQAVEGHVRGQGLGHQPLWLEGKHPAPLAHHPGKGPACGCRCWRPRQSRSGPDGTTGPVPRFLPGSIRRSAPRSGQ